MADKKKRMPTQRKGSHPTKTNKTINKLFVTPEKFGKGWKATIGAMNTVGTKGTAFLEKNLPIYQPLSGGGLALNALKVAPSLGRAAKAAGTSLLKDFQGSGVQQRFEGTPLTVETKFETESSPMKAMARMGPEKAAARMGRRMKKRSTISYPDEGPANAPRSEKRRGHRKGPMPANTGRTE